MICRNINLVSPPDGHRDLAEICAPQQCDGVTGYVVYCTVKEMPWFREVSKKAIGKKGSVVADVPETSDKSEWLTGTPHDVLQRKKGSKKGK